MKRQILLACTFAMAMGSIAVAAPASADTCPWGTVPRFDGVCTQGHSGGAPPAGITVPPQGADIVSLPGQYPTVNGIPCSQEHLGTCYAMSQNG
ncbi:hypothetical protein Mycsm_00394 [Mycobacterium sp. JS623]|uniref:hypothetical protein n=1 Tax=Mycobacterium sp. JS623 TaxID=212767 RepID=UPI0002A5549F|nr:hypothetical protein [Mycobacterium sp. JS623]AGB20847.1 hypothetical protein Mycsm_00394 [Mycobacterium sp. JS623]